MIPVGTRLACLATCAFITFAAPSSVASVVFADSFDDGDVSDWTTSTNHAGLSAVTTRSDQFVSASGAMFVYLDAPPGGTSLFVRASRTFTAPVAGDYVLRVAAKSSECDICTIAYEVLVDGAVVAQRSVPGDFEPVVVNLTALAPGSHTVGLGMSTTLAISGRFNASFDDLVITGPGLPPGTAVAAPGALAALPALLLAGMKRRGRRAC